MNTKRFALAAICISVSVQAVHAHPGVLVPGSGVVAGLLHPLLGLDHLLAMFTLGLFSAQLGRRAMWAVPAAFLVGAIAGGVAGLAGTLLPSVELAIAASVFLLGAALALNRKYYLAIPLAAAGLFGVFHGHAHGTEAPLAANPTLYVLGFATSTLTLQITGLAIGVKAAQFRSGALALRLAGASIAAIGFLLLLGIRA